MPLSANAPRRAHCPHSRTPRRPAAPTTHQPLAPLHSRTPELPMRQPIFASKRSAARRIHIPRRSSVCSVVLPLSAAAIATRPSSLMSFPAHAQSRAHCPHSRTPRRPHTGCLRRSARAIPSFPMRPPIFASTRSEANRHTTENEFLQRRVTFERGRKGDSARIVSAVCCTRATPCIPASKRSDPNPHTAA